MRHVLDVALLLNIAAVGSLPAQEIDGCGLISQSDVESVIGEKLSRKPRLVRRTYGTVENYGCNYKSDLWTVEVRVETGRDKEGLDMYLKALTGTVKQTTSSTLQSVRGLGDQAWWGPVNPTNGILHVVRGTDLVWVQTYGKGTGAGSLEKTREITEKAFAGYRKARP